MFDAEKLLGTLMREVVGSGSSYGKKKKKKKKHTNGLVNSLKTGAGLMTAIGLGIGAYEILRSKNQPQTTGYTTAIPQVPPTAEHRPAAGRDQPPPVMPPPLPGSAPQPRDSMTAQELARRMIQVMIAAAHADGTMDEREEQAVLERLKGANLSQEERMFLLAELHSPKPIPTLIEGITDPSTAKAMYMLAINAVDIDTERERQWFDDLASRLGISKAVQAFIEEQI